MSIFRREKAGCSGSSRQRSPGNTGSPGREQINCAERQQKIRNEHCRSGVIFRHPLPEEKRDDRDGGNRRAIKCNRRIPRKNYHDASNRTQNPGCNLEDGDRGHHRRHNCRQRTLGEVSFQPFQVTTPIHNFINARLKEKDRKKRRGENLHEIYCSSECVQGWHREDILGGTTWRCRSCFAPDLRRKWGAQAASLLFAAACREHLQVLAPRQCQPGSACLSESCAIDGLTRKAYGLSCEARISRDSARTRKVCRLIALNYPGVIRKVRTWKRHLQTSKTRFAATSICMASQRRVAKFARWKS